MLDFIKINKGHTDEYHFNYGSKFGSIRESDCGTWYFTILDADDKLNTIRGIYLTLREARIAVRKSLFN